MIYSRYDLWNILNKLILKKTKQHTTTKALNIIKHANS